MTEQLRINALKSLEAMFEQAKDAPEMSLDEINAEIAAVREALGEGFTPHK